MVSKYTLRYEFSSRTSERPQKIKLTKNVHSEKNTMDTVLFALDSEIKYFRTLLHNEDNRDTKSKCDVSNNPGVNKSRKQKT